MRKQETTVQEEGSRRRSKASVEAAAAAVAPRFTYSLQEQQASGCAQCK